MNYKEIHGDLFSGLHKDKEGFIESIRDTKEVYCHCIANDGRWGAGIAPIFIDKVFQSRYWLTPALQNRPWNGHGKAIIGQYYNYNNTKFVFDANLITKRLTCEKPTYTTVRESLEDLKTYIKGFNLNSPESYHIKRINMPKIGAGLDKLEWDKVSKIVQDTFADMDLDVVVYYL